MNLNELIIAGIGLLTTITSGWASWFFARKKYNAEVDSNYIENLGKGLNTYDAIITHNKKQIEELITENQELRRELGELRRQVLKLSVSICTDLSCKKRSENQIIIKDENGKTKGRLNQTEAIS